MEIIPIIYARQGLIISCVLFQRLAFWLEFISYGAPERTCKNVFLLDVQTNKFVQT